MDRREALKALAMGVPAVAISAVVHGEVNARNVGGGRAQLLGLPFQGVGVLRYPAGESMDVDGTMKPNVEFVQRILEEGIQSGAVIAFSNQRDYPAGPYSWDFRIEGGPADQVKVERHPHGEA